MALPGGVDVTGMLGDRNDEVLTDEVLGYEGMP